MWPYKDWRNAREKKGRKKQHNKKFFDFQRIQTQRDWIGIYWLERNTNKVVHNQ